MKACLSPSKVQGSITIPPSKSMSHRSIICAALAKGTSIIHNVDYSKDILATIHGMELLGANIQKQKDTLIIKGVQNFCCMANNVFCNESGSTLRFFIPIFSLCNQRITFTGAGRLMQRPQSVYADIFNDQGLFYHQDENGITIRESLQAGTYHMKGDVSSQFISGLLFTLPLLKEDSTIIIEPPFESKSYIDLTIQMLATFGIHVTYTNDHTIYVPGNQQYKACEYTIEGDYSQMAFFAVLAAIQADLDIYGIRHDSLQGDKAIIRILKNANAQLHEIEGGYRVQKSKLQGSKIDLSDCPDLGPILTVMAMYASGQTTIYHARRLRIKESDRIAAMEEELRKFGTDITSSEDEIYINGNPVCHCNEILYAHKDHRVVMALSVALLCAQQAGCIKGAQAIEKSYPSFFEDVKRIQGEVTLHD